MATFRRQAGSGRVRDRKAGPVLIPDILLIHRSISLDATREGVKPSVCGRNEPSGDGRTLPATCRCETADSREDISRITQAGRPGKPSRCRQGKARAFDESGATNFEDHPAEPDSRSEEHT